MWMRLFRTILVKMYFVREYIDANGQKQHAMRLLNPLSWVLLICIAVVMGCISGVRMGYGVVYTVLSDALDAQEGPKKEPSQAPAP